MSSKDAIKKLKEWQRYFQSLDLDVGSEDDVTNERDSLEAFTTAIRHIQAWDKVKEEIKDHAIEVEMFGICNDFISVAILNDIIGKHLQEVEND